MERQIKCPDSVEHSNLKYSNILEHSNSKTLKNPKTFNNSTFQLPIYYQTFSQKQKNKKLANGSRKMDSSHSSEGLQRRGKNVSSQVGKSMSFGKMFQTPWNIENVDHYEIPVRSNFNHSVFSGSRESLRFHGTSRTWTVHSIPNIWNMCNFNLDVTESQVNS